MFCDLRIFTIGKVYFKASVIFHITLSPCWMHVYDRDSLLYFLFFFVPEPNDGSRPDFSIVVSLLVLMDMVICYNRW